MFKMKTPVSDFAARPASLPIGPMTSRWLGDNRVSAAAKDAWLTNGFVVLKNVFGDAEIDRYNEIVAGIRAVVDDGKDENGFGDRVGQLHQKETDLLKMASSPTVRAFLDWAFDDEAIVFASLNFHKGTQQDAHIDAIFFWPEPCYSMAGAWVALEDIHPDSGPLFYVPTSHKWPFFQSHHVVESRPDLARRRLEAREGRLEPAAHGDLIRDMGNAWTDDFKKLEAERGSERIPMPIRKGDVVIWHSLLAHGGSPRLNSLLSRKSVVFHFIGSKTKLYTNEQFFLYGRHELADLPSQQTPRGVFASGLQYMKYPHFVTYGAGGREIIHPL